MKSIPDIFGSMVFNDAVQKSKLPKDIYKALNKTIELGSHLEIEVANVVANAMKDWATERGATHFTHWFQPMTGVTAEKHESFIAFSGGGKVMMEFSGKELVRGEPDASSFPSGGLRATFEARGYTVWDITSYAFIKDRTLFIPTAFCSYCGEALDKKTPLLRSMDVINKHALRILKVFGNTIAKRVVTTVGAEQEYFLVDRDTYLKRPDLVYTGRTLFGAKPPKGQELSDHYYGSLKPKIAAFMHDLDEELWKLGVFAKTKHNEGAPSQHELAPIFTTTNVASDHNQLTMEMMKTVASKHGLACLLHEKPFVGVNGSGKHNNWSISTDTGSNLLEPGVTPHENAQFLLFLVAVVKAVDDYQDLLRLSVASAGNDHRLGAHEAPPAIVSIFLGEELTGILEAIDNDSVYNQKQNHQMEIGVTSLPHFPRDTTDRNRTSPFAFTGNKFEFRMVGSAASLAGPNIVLNTIVADTLDGFANRLEVAKDFQKELSELIKQTIKDHKRIIFNGDNYLDKWVKEAEERGLSNFKSTIQAMPALITPKNIDIFIKHHVFAEKEIHSRYEILIQNYIKTVRIEALTMVDIVKKQIIPSIISYQSEITQLLTFKKVYGQYESVLESQILMKLSKLSTTLIEKLESLENSLITKEISSDNLAVGNYYKDVVLESISSIRYTIDEIEPLVAKKHWNLPTYAEILYSI